uniref:Sodium/potassium/calcium exchanger 5 n=4 Tax=Timema TaxID=61471 RepID=A0A7R9FMV7_9NEOP|nr:unnamed protein product [Timema tahoe]
MTWLDDQQIFDANCTPPAIDDFPRDLFSERQRQDGAVVLHVFTSLYLFVALAVVCDKYFVPAVERICQALNMSNDVAGATFMAAATSAPELFVNVIGTFITEGDIGVGTIVGSAVFNILAVAACCGIGAGIVVPLDWWPLTRDCLAYGVTVSLMICIIHDERVEWYEALTLVLLYIVYTAVMYWDKPIQQCTRARLGLTTDRPTKNSENCVETGEVGVPLQTDAASPQHQLQIQQQQLQQNGRIKVSTDRVPQEDSQDEESVNRKTTSDSPDRDLNLDLTILVSLAQHETSALSNYATEKWWKQLAWLFIWPIHLVFLVTIPDCEKPRFKKWFPLTFIMCIIWIGSLSYVVAWMITIIGDTLKIPDSVMGITFLAAGTSVPEAVSSVIVAKQGHGSMGISNSIGSNTFDILLCLGLPWLIKASFLPAMEGQHFVRINSRGLEYSAISLLSTLMLLYATFSCNRFQLDRKVGQACLLMYAMFLVLASLIELNVFFKVNLPTCGRTVNDDPQNVLAFLDGMSRSKMSSSSVKRQLEDVSVSHLFEKAIKLSYVTKEQYCFLTLSLPTITLPPTATNVAGTINLPLTLGLPHVPPRLTLPEHSRRPFSYPYPHVSEHTVTVVMTSTSYPRSRSEG